ncbi:MAG: RagB/SusD family nutrient uptake outer membrane protein [Muribaculaceae bacterium]
MKSKILSLFLVGVTMTFNSCSDYLDMTPTDGPSDKLVWSKAEYAELAVNDFYESINYFGNYNDGQCLAGMTEALTDEFKYGSTTYNANCYIPSEISYGGSVLSATYVATYLGNWNDVYKKVRRANEAISLLHKYGNFAEADKTRLEAELRFFRGMYYFDLVKRYKGVIIYDEHMENYTKDKAISTETEGWDFVEADLTYAAKNLPVSKVPNGRLTSGAAYGLLSRAMLYAERWDKAETAAGEVMKMGYTMPKNLRAAFTVGGEEAILQYAFNMNGVTHGFDNYYAPGGDRKLDGNDIVGAYGTPTQEMVESFELATGGFPDWSAWHDKEGTKEVPPYELLEPRFKATILYNGASWKGRTIEPFVGGVDGWAEWKVEPSPDGRTTTGYFLKKMVNEDHSFLKNTKCESPWTAIRYAEILLNYAEACYHTGNVKGAQGALKQVRDRVDLPTANLTGEELMAAIRQERKVELAYEGQYYWDMRRWKLSERVFSNYRVHGFKIEKIGEAFKYSYVECDTENRNFPSKMYSCPMPESELSNNGKVTQYTEWN